MEITLTNQRGRSAAINCGFEQAETTFIAITDDDCFVDQACCSQWPRLQPDEIVLGRVAAVGENMIGVVMPTVPATYHRPNELPRRKRTGYRSAQVAWVAGHVIACTVFLDLGSEHLAGLPLL